jgi:hypothetical protein
MAPVTNLGLRKKNNYFFLPEPTQGLWAGTGVQTPGSQVTVSGPQMTLEGP